MDWDDLRTFLAIARQGTLSGAARALGVTQPTMGRRLAALERRTGARLLEKRPGRYAITPLGEAVLTNAERIEAEAVEAERRISGRDVALDGVVRVSTVDVLAASLVAPAIGRVRAVHPGICVELTPETRTVSLSRREADLALRVARFSGAEIIARRLGSLQIAAYGPAGADTPAEASALPLITVLDDQDHLPEAKWLRDVHPRAPVAVRTNSREAQLAAVRAGLGIAALPRVLADPVPDIVRVRCDQPALSREIWLGVHRDLRDMPRVRAVADAVAAEARAAARRLDPPA